MGSTTSRGYGGAHQSLRRARLAAWRPGDPCAHCGRPITTLWLLTINGRRVSAVDLPHNAARTGYLPGLAHRACNRRDGGTIGNRSPLRRAARARQAAARTWSRW